MAIDYSRSAIPKGTVTALDKAEARRELAKVDREENAKVRARAGGKCEVRDLHVRCWRKDVHTHHLLGGIGRRNKGKSILAAYKLRVCAICHADIHAKVLRPTTATHDAATVRYWRSRSRERAPGEGEP